MGGIRGEEGASELGHSGCDVQERRGVDEEEVVRSNYLARCRCSVHRLPGWVRSESRPSHRGVSQVALLGDRSPVSPGTSPEPDERTRSGTGDIGFFFGAVSNPSSCFASNLAGMPGGVPDTHRRNMCLGRTDSRTSTECPCLFGVETNEPSNSEMEMKIQRRDDGTYQIGHRTLPSDPLIPQ